MKKLILSSFLALFILSVAALINCGEAELDSIECGENTYRVMREPVYQEVNGEKINTSSNGVVQVDGLDKFPEKLTLTIYKSEDYHCNPNSFWPDCKRDVLVGTYTIEANTPSPYTFVEDVPKLSSASIVAPSCPEPIEKSKEDIDNDTKDIACADLGSLEVNEDRCYLETSFTWSSDVSLTGVSFSFHGVTIDLSAGTSITFNSSELDFEDNEYVLSGTDAICAISTNLTQCAGFTGTVSVTDPVAAEDVMTITVTDYDLATGDDFSVTVTTNLGESESVTLSETESGSGVFEGTINTVLAGNAGTNNNGSLNIENGVVITATYNDEANDEGNAQTITVSVTASGDFAPTCSDGIQNGDETGVDCGGSNCSACEVGDALTFENTTYVITDASYLDYPFDGKEYILFTLSRYENEMQVFTTGIEIVATTITSETYQFGDADYGVTGSIGLNNSPDYATINGGYVVVVITPLGDYALELHLSTDKGAFTGSYTVPSGF